MKFLIGADIVPTKSNMELFCAADAQALLGDELKALLDGASYRIFNLETPLADTLTPIEKCGPCFCVPTQAVNGIKALGADLVTLANNHILDQGQQGLQSTIQTLQQAGIAFSGVGENLEQSRTPYIVEIEGRKIGIFCCAEHEFSIATEQSAGACPYDPLESFDIVASLREQCEFIIVLYHGGKEYCRYPSPDLQKMCRKFVECGAGLVLCQHTHCIGCAETYQGATIVYGQGNFCFDAFRNEKWRSALLVECDWTDGEVMVRYHPICQQGNAIRLASGEQANSILGEFAARSQEITCPQTLRARYQEFAAQSYAQLLSRVNATPVRSLFFRVKGRIFGKEYLSSYLKKHYGKQELLVLKNTVESESWRQALLAAIDCAIEEKNREEEA